MASAGIRVAHPLCGDARILEAGGMDPSVDLWVRLACEFIGVAIMIIIGNGAVANVHLKGTKGFMAGWASSRWGTASA